MLKPHPYKVVLTIMVGFLILFWVTELRSFFIVAVVIGLLSALSERMAKVITECWLRLGQILGRVVSPLILGLIYYCFLTPLALLARFARKKDELNLKNHSESLFKEAQQKYDTSFFEKMW